MLLYMGCCNSTFSHNGIKIELIIEGVISGDLMTSNIIYNINYKMIPSNSTHNPSRLDILGWSSFQLTFINTQNSSPRSKVLNSSKFITVYHL